MPRADETPVSHDAWVIRRSALKHLIETSQAIDLDRGRYRRKISASELQASLQTARYGALRLRGARIVGRLDLSHQIVLAALSFVDCVIPDGIDVSGASIPALAVTESSLSHFNGNSLKLASDLDLEGTTITGTVATKLSRLAPAGLWLCEAQIGGRLHCRGLRIEARQARAIQADRMTLGGTARFNGGFTAGGQVRMIGARIEGSIDLEGATFLDPYQGVCLDLADASIGTLYVVKDDGDGCIFDGRVDLSRTQVAGVLHIDGASFTAPESPASIKYDADDVLAGCVINARGLRVGGLMTMTGSTVVRGGIDLSQADLGGLRLRSTCRLIAPKAIAVDLANSIVHSVLVIGPGLVSDQRPADDGGQAAQLQHPMEIAGTLRLRDARIEGALIMGETTWIEPRPHGTGSRSRNNSIHGVGVSVLGDVDLDKAIFRGGVNLRKAQLGTLEAVAAQVLNQDGEYSLNLNGATITEAPQV